MSEDDENVDIQFPLSFAVKGTPLSFGATAKSKNRWKQRILDVLDKSIPNYKFASTELLTLTIYDFPAELPEGDVDNIVKVIQDSMNTRVYLDDQQIRRVVAQRFLPSDYSDDENIPDLVAEALVNDPPFVYICVSENPYGDAI